jgi:hypothetical protein
MMKVLKFDAKTGVATIELQLDMKGRPSTSGKTTVHFSTNGNQRVDEIQVGGRPLVIGINAYTPKG